MNNIDTQINPFLETLLFKFLKTNHSPSGKVQYTLELYNTIREIENLSNLSDISISVKSIHYGNFDKAIISENSNYIIEHFLGIKESALRTTNLNNENYLKDLISYKDFLMFNIPNDIKNNVAYEYSITKDESRLISKYAQDKNHNKIKQIIQNSELREFHVEHYPIFRLLNNLPFETATEVMSFWLEKGIVNKEQLIIESNNIYHGKTVQVNFMKSLIERKEWDNLVSFMDLMKIQFKEIYPMLFQIDDSNTLLSILNKEGLNPYEPVEITTYDYYNTNLKTTKKTNISEEISNSKLDNKIEILQMIANNFKNTFEDPEDAKIKEFLNILSKGSGIREAKGFIKNRNLELDRLIQYNENNNNLLKSVYLTSSWWMLPIVIDAEKQIASSEKNPNKLFANMLFLNDSHSYLNQATSHLIKNIDLDLLVNQIGNIREVVLKLMTENKLNINTWLLKKPESYYTTQPEKNIFQVISNLVENQPLTNKQIIKEHHFIYPNNGVLESTYQNNFNKRTINDFYYFINTIKDKSELKNDTFLNLERLTLQHILKDNEISLTNLMFVLTDYASSSLNPNVSDDKMLKFENKILDLTSSFISHIFKSDETTWKNHIVKSLNMIDFIQTSLATHGRNPNEFQERLATNDRYIDSLCSFATLLKEVSINDNRFEKLKESMIESTQKMFHESLESQAKINTGSTIKVKKF